jgi:exonuclease SbcD
MQERCAGIRAAALARAAGTPLVVAAHAFVRGGSGDGSERTVFGQAEAIGSLGVIEAASLAEGAAYAAFGHLHRPQRVGGRDHWRYCGSLLPSSFAGTPGGCVLVTIDGPGPAAAEAFALPEFRLLRELTGSPDELRAAIAALPPAAPGEGAPLLLARVRLAGERHGVAAEITAWARERGWLAVRVLREAVQTASPMAAAPVPLEELQPLDVLRAAHRAGFGGHEPSAVLLAAFAGLLEDERAGLPP